MQSQTKIIVISQKKLFIIVLLILMITAFILLYIFLSPNKSDDNQNNSQAANANVASDITYDSIDSLKPTYAPGVYTSSFTMDSINYSVKVTLDSNNINNIELINNNDVTETMSSPNLDTFNSIKEEIISSQNLHSFNIDSTNRYTSETFINAIECAINKSIN